MSRKGNLRLSSEDAIRLYEIVRYMLRPYRADAWDWEMKEKVEDNLGQYPDFVGGFCKLVLAKAGLLTKHMSFLIDTHSCGKLENLFYEQCGFESYGQAYVDIYNDYGARALFEQAGVLMDGVFAARRFADEVLFEPIDGEFDLLDACARIDQAYEELPPVLEESDYDEEYDYPDYDLDVGYERGSWEYYEGIAEGEAVRLAKGFADDLRAILSGKIAYEDVDTTELASFYDIVCTLDESFEVRKKDFIEKLPALMFMVFGGGRVRFRSLVNGIRYEEWSLFHKKSNRLFVDPLENGRIMVSNNTTCSYGEGCVALSYMRIKGYGEILKKVSEYPSDTDDKEIEVFRWACEVCAVNRYMTGYILDNLAGTYANKDNDLITSRMYPEDTDSSRGGVSYVGPSIAEIFAPLILVSVADSLMQKIGMEDAA